MRYAQTFQQRRRYFLKCAAIVAVPFILDSACGAQVQVTSAAPAPQAPWTQELNKYPGLLDEFGRLFDKFQRNLQFPPARSASRLLPLLPESTMSYAAFPNYGDVAHQALTVFRQDLHDNSIPPNWCHTDDLPPP